MSGDVCINIGGESKVSISIYINLSTCCRYIQGQTLEVLTLFTGFVCICDLGICSVFYILVFFYLFTLDKLYCILG